jgi:hypothetical protein
LQPAISPSEVNVVSSTKPRTDTQPRKIAQLIALSKDAKEAAKEEGGKLSDSKKRKDFNTSFVETKQMELQMLRDKAEMAQELQRLHHRLRQWNTGQPRDDYNAESTRRCQENSS